MVENKSGDITLIYNSDKAVDKKAKAFVESFPYHSIQVIDLTKVSLTENQLTDLAQKMRINIEDLLDPTFDDHISVHKEGLKIMARRELLTLMTRDSKLINTPLLVIGNRAYKYGSAYELFKEDITTKVSSSK